MKSLLSRALLRTMRPGRYQRFLEFRSNERLPAADLAALGKRRLTSLLRHACRTVPFYREFCRHNGLDPEHVDAGDLPRFPSLDKHDLMRDQERFYSDARDLNDRVPNATGGSSGVWFQFFVDRTSIDKRTGNAMRSASWTGWRPGEKQAVLWGHPRDNRITHSLRGRLMADLVHRSANLNAYNMDDRALEEYTRRLQTWRPTMIRGYASALAFLSEHLVRRGIRLDSVKGLISSAETLTDDYRRTVEKVFDGKLLNRYGSREFADIAQQCEEVDGLHVFIDRVHVEILDPEGNPCPPGHRGEIVVTDLENGVMPFIRYRTGDLAWFREDACPCGRGLPLLGAVEGRTSELIVGKNGKYYSCQSPRLFGSDIHGIGQMQLIQDSLEEILIKIVPDARWNQDSQDALRERMCSLLGDIDVVIRLVDEIPPAPSGKYPFTISRVSPFHRQDHK